MSQTVSHTRLRAKLSATKETPKDSLSHQYGGVHAGGWVERLPPSWIPYIQLSRLSPPAGLLLIILPHIFGVIHGAILNRSSVEEALRVCAVLVAGSFFCNNASHAWNDLVDAPIDKLIARTRTRPIPRGAISPRAAFIFTVVQTLGAASCLLLLPASTAILACPTIIGTVYYPYAKRHTNFAQVVLGFCLTWGIMVGSSAIGVEQSWTNKSTVSLVVACIIWVVIFDTIYAHQDLADDLKVGVKSIAVLFRNHAKPLFWTLLTCMGLLLFASGWYGGMGLVYYIITVGGCVSSVGAMIATVDLKDPSSCWKWFSKGFHFTGASIAVGLLAEYILR